jgi:hypothetical protein
MSHVPWTPVVNLTTLLQTYPGHHALPSWTAYPPVVLLGTSDICLKTAKLLISGETHTTDFTSFVCLDFFVF